MSIINMISNTSETFPDGSFCDLSYARPSDRQEDGTPRNVIVLYRSHHGLCLQDSEVNGYHDSDFYMVVWNEAKSEPERICFASTRGWSYPCYGSAVDATPEVCAKYAAWKKEQQEEHRRACRRAEAKKVRDFRQLIVFAAHTHSIGYARLLRLRHKMPLDHFRGVVWLLNARVRGNFSTSLRSQVLAWFADPSPKYPAPLSPKQRSFIARKE